jgi:hypothetical protein
VRFMFVRMVAGAFVCVRESGRVLCCVCVSRRLCVIGLVI